PTAGEGGSGGGGPSGGTGGTVPTPPADAGVAPDTGAPPATPIEGGRIPDGLTQMLSARAIGLGYYHACHLLASQDIKCYGSPASEPRLMPPAIKSNQIFCAHNGCCVLTGGDASPQPLVDEPAPGDTLPLMIRAKRLACWGHKNTFFPPAN